MSLLKQEINKKLSTISDALWEYITPEAVKDIIGKQADDIYSKIETENVNAAQIKLPKLKKLQTNFCKNHCKSAICHCHEQEKARKLKPSYEVQNFKCAPDKCWECNNMLC